MWSHHGRFGGGDCHQLAGRLIHLHGQSMLLMVPAVTLQTMRIHGHMYPCTTQRAFTR